MTPGGLLALFRFEANDVERPFIWPDDLVYTYIDDAQKQFCRDTNGILDSRSFKLKVVAGTEWYKLDPKILKLRDAIDPATGAPVPIVAAEKMRDYGMRFDGAVAPIKALVAGLDENILRAWPVPALDATIELRTFRLPETVGAGDDFEIAEQHHRHLLHWVKHLAYDVQDTETYDKGASEKYEMKHRAYCAKALVEQDRARRPVSTVTYGGI